MGEKEGNIKMEKYKAKPERRYCRNCGQVILGFRDAEGYLRLTCPKCKAVSISKIMSRRHEVVQEYAPPGQIIIN